MNSIPAKQRILNRISLFSVNWMLLDIQAFVYCCIVLAFKNDLLFNEKQKVIIAFENQIDGRASFSVDKGAKNC